jgi:hypothetical protein
MPAIASTVPTSAQAPSLSPKPKTIAHGLNPYCEM